MLFRSPGTIRLRVRNLGDAVDSAVIRIRPHGGRIEGDGTLSCVLEPFAVAEQCYTLWAEVGTIQIELGRDGADGVIGGLGVEAIDEALTPGPKP